METSSNEIREYTAHVKHIAERYGVSRQHVYNLVDDTDIPHRRIGTAIRFNLDEVDEWMRARSQPPEPEAGAAPEDTDPRLAVGGNGGDMASQRRRTPRPLSNAVPLVSVASARRASRPLDGVSS